MFLKFIAQRSFVTKVSIHFRRETNQQHTTSARTLYIISDNLYLLIQFLNRKLQTQFQKTSNLNCVNKRYIALEFSHGGKHQSNDEFKQTCQAQYLPYGLWQHELFEKVFLSYTRLIKSLICLVLLSFIVLP